MSEKEDKIRYLRSAWDKFNIGNKLSNKEIKDLLKSARAGREYLVSRGQYLAAHKTIHDIINLESMLKARRGKK